MIHFKSGAAVAITLLAAAELMASHAGAATALAGSSNGSVLDSVFTINGQKSSLIHQVYSAGSAPPAYSKDAAVPSYSKTGTFTGGLTLVGTGKTLASTAVAKTAAASITTSSTAAIGSFSATLSSPLGTVLTANLTKTSSNAKLIKRKSGVNTPTASVKFGTLKINAPAFGINNLTVSGTQTPNKKLFQNADKSVTVYANKQTITQVAGKPPSVTVTAVNLHVHNFNYQGVVTVSGDLDLATSIAK